VPQPHGFHDLAVVPIVLADQKVRDSARIVEIASHNPREDDGHVFAVEPHPKAKEMTMRSAPLFSPLHRLNNADSYRGVRQIVHQLLSLRKVSLFAIRDRKAVKQSPQSLALRSLQVCFRCTGFRLQSVSLDFE